MKKHIAKTIVHKNAFDENSSDFFTTSYYCVTRGTTVSSRGCKQQEQNKRVYSSNDTAECPTLCVSQSLGQLSAQLSNA